MKKIVDLGSALEDSMRKAADENENDVSLSTLLQRNPLLPSQALLMDAARCNNTSLISTLIKEKGVDVKISNNEKRTALHWAAANGHVEAIDVLIKAGADVKAVDKYGMNAFLLAAWYGHNKAVLRLSKHFAYDLNCKNKQGMNILHCACANDQEHIVEFIGDCLEKFDFEQLDASGKAGIHLAAERGYCDVIRQLELLNCNMNLLTNDGETPLLLALKKRHIDAVNLLFESNQPISVEVRDKHGYAAVHWCSEAGYEEGFNALCDNTPQGFNVNLCTETVLNTPLMLAVFNNHPNLVQKIVSRPECDLNLQNHNGNTALHMCAEAKKENCLIANILLKSKRCDVNIKNYNRQLALHLAAEKGFVLVAQVLIEHGSRLNSKDKFGRNPLSVAVRGGEIKIIDTIIRAQRLAQLSGLKSFYQPIFDQTLCCAPKMEDTNSLMSTATTEMSLDFAVESDGSDCQPITDICSHSNNSIGSPLNNSIRSQPIDENAKNLKENIREDRNSSATPKNPWLEKEEKNDPPSAESNNNIFKLFKSQRDSNTGDTNQQTALFSANIFSRLFNSKTEESKMETSNPNDTNEITNDVDNDEETNDVETNDSKTNDAETNDAETNDVATNDVSASKEVTSWTPTNGDVIEVETDQSESTINNGNDDVMISLKTEDDLQMASDDTIVAVADNVTNEDIIDKVDKVSVRSLPAALPVRFKDKRLSLQTGNASPTSALALNISSEWVCTDSRGNLVAKALPTATVGMATMLLMPQIGEEENEDGGVPTQILSPINMALQDLNQMTRAKMQFWKMSKMMQPADWKKLAHHWNFQDFQVKAIEKQHIGKRSFRDHGYRLMVIWLNCYQILKIYDKAGRDLILAFISIDRKSLAEYARKHFDSEQNKKCVIS